MIIQRTLLIATFVALVWAIGLSLGGWSLTDWQFWCLGLMFWAAEALGRLTGRIEGIIDYIDMSEQDQLNLRRAVERARRESNG